MEMITQDEAKENIESLCNDFSKVIQLMIESTTLSAAMFCFGRYYPDIKYKIELLQEYILQSPAENKKTESFMEGSKTPVAGNGELSTK